MLVAWAKLTTRNVASKSRRAPPSSISTRWRIPAATKTPITTKTPPKTACATKPAQPSTQPRRAAISGRSDPNAPRPEPTTDRKMAW